jgi:hypothetical protein
MEGCLVTGPHGFRKLCKGLTAPACLVLLGTGGALAQTEAPEPLPEPPETAQDSAGTDGLGVDADRDVPAGVEPAASGNREAAVQADADVTAMAPPLKDQVAACYPGTSQADSDEEVRISFVLDSAGLLLGIPEHVGNETQSAVQRRLFLDAVVALEDCAPYSVSGVETTYTATFTQAAVTSIDILEAAPRPTAPADLGRARVDTTAFATEEIESALDLSRGERREIQNRLRLIDHDPGGADGVFGPNTRTAISSWQAARGYPASGYLNDVQLTVLREESRTEYEAFQQSQPKKERKAKRVRVCKRGVFGVLYDCRFVWR